MVARQVRQRRPPPYLKGLSEGPHRVFIPPSACVGSAARRERREPQDVDSWPPEPAIAGADAARRGLGVVAGAVVRCLLQVATYVSRTSAAVPDGSSPHNRSIRVPPKTTRFPRARAAPSSRVASAHQAQQVPPCGWTSRSQQAHIQLSRVHKTHSRRSNLTWPACGPQSHCSRFPWAGPSLRGAERSRNEDVGRHVTRTALRRTTAGQRIGYRHDDKCLGEILGAAVEAIGLAIVGLRLLRNDAGSPAVPERTRLHVGPDGRHRRQATHAPAPEYSPRGARDDNTPHRPAGRRPSADHH